MDDQHDEKPKPKRKPPSRAGKGPTAGSWRPGTSGNPAGRPPKIAGAFAERVREKVDPDLVIDLALKVVADETLPPRERLTALWPLVDRGWTKPPTDVNVTNNAQPTHDLSHVSDEQLRQATELYERADALLKAPSGAQPDGPTDDNTPSTSTPCPPRALTDGDTP